MGENRHLADARVVDSVGDEVTQAFELALAQTLGFEGEFSNHPLDAGGRTYRGITQRAYDAFRRAKGRALQPVENVTDAELREFYFEEYWVPAGCEQLHASLARAVFDMAVNSGTWKAKLTLQAALGVKEDGVIGPATIAASKAARDPTLQFLKKRGAHYQAVIRARPSQVEFLGGWINRLLDQAWKGGGS